MVCNAIFAGRLRCKLRRVNFRDKKSFHGMTVFVLWHDILCHAVENSLSGSKRVLNAQPGHPRCNRGRVLALPDL